MESICFFRLSFSASPVSSNQILEDSFRYKLQAVESRTVSYNGGLSNSVLFSNVSFDQFEFPAESRLQE